MLTPAARVAVLVILGVWACSGSQACAPGPAGRESSEAPVRDLGDVPQVTGPLPEGANRERLQRDLEMVWHLRERLPITSRPGELSRVWPRVGRGRPLEWGARIIKSRVSAGTGHCEVDALIFAEQVAKARISCRFFRGITAEGWANIQRALGGDFEVSEQPWGYLAQLVVYHSSPWRAYRRRVAEELRAQRSIRVPESLKADYEYLDDPLASRSLRDCGIVSIPSRRSRAAQVLVRAGRDDLLRNVLRGPNPASRVVAAGSLSAMKKLAPEDWRIINRLSRLDISVGTGSGCVVLETTEAASLPRLKARE